MQCKDSLPDGQYPILKTWINCQKDEYVKVIYSDAKEGRLSFHLDNEKHSGISLGTMWNKTRSAFASGVLRDYDIENCHPDIIRQIATKKKISNDHLTDYCLNRDKYFETYGKSIKKRIIAWINGSAYNEKTEDLLELYEEINCIMTDILKGTKLFKEIQKLDFKERGKMIRSLRAIYSQDLEKKVLLVMYNTCVQHKVKVSSLVYDGLMLYTDTIPDSFDIILEKEVKKKLNFDIKIVEKYIPEFKVTDWLNDLVIEDDKEAVELFLSLYPNIIKSRGSIFVLKENIWTSDEDYVRKLILTSGIKKKGGKGTSKPYSSNIQGCLNIFKTLCIKLDSTDDFIKTKNEETLGYVFYKNGYYDLNKQIFFNDLKKTTLVRIERDYVNSNYSNDHPHVIDIYDKLFACLGSKELIRYFCIAVSRAIGGYIIDKVGYILTGQRNSGKGTLNTSLELVFEKYVTAIPPPISNSQVSDTKSKAFLIDKNCDLSRIAYSNEGVSKDGDTTLDGSLLKGMCSGGDSIPCRTNFKNNIDVINNTTLFISFNQVPKSKPADALSTFKIFPFPYSYKADPNPKIKYEKMSFDIKTYIKETKYFIKCFEWIIFNSFTKESIHHKSTPECCIVEKGIIEDDNMVDFSSCFSKYYELHNKSYVKASDLHYLFSQRMKISPAKTGKLMKEAGYPKKKKQIKQNRYWLYEGMRLKVNDDEDEINDLNEDEDEYY